MSQPGNGEGGDREADVPTRQPGRDLALALAIASLPQMTPRRLALLLHGRPAEEVWSELAHGGARVVSVLASLRTGRGEPAPGRARGRAPVEQVAEAWRRVAATYDVAARTREVVAREIRIVRHGSPGYPARLLDDRDPPELLFVRGAAPERRGPVVAVVGTRRATHYGREVAAELGAGLTRAGVTVVSGLAAGIDAAAHEGALAADVVAGAEPVGILGGGVDVDFPAANRRLIARTATAGSVISEAPPGAAPEPWRFPLRNRLIAALAHAVVVVESARSGGAMHTVEAALARGREVLAVPGSVRSPASEGTNELLSAGAEVARGVEDVLVALERLGFAVGESRLAPPGSEAPAGSLELDQRGPLERSVLDALDEHPRPIDVICSRTGLGLGEVAVVLDRLMELSLAEATDAGWRRRS